LWRRRLVKNLLNKNSNYVILFGNFFVSCILIILLLLGASKGGSGPGIKEPLRGPVYSPLNFKIHSPN
jgi:hypothetical protein